MSKERNFLQPKVTFTKLGIQLIFPKLLQHKSQILFMFFFILGENQNIINEH
jgi:hypothetical protein